MRNKETKSSKNIDFHSAQSNCYRRTNQCCPHLQKFLLEMKESQLCCFTVSSSPLQLYFGGGENLINLIQPDQGGESEREIVYARQENSHNYSAEPEEEAADNEE